MNSEGDDENDDSENEVLLGGAEAVAQLRLTSSAVANSAFFDEWSALTTALVVLLANAAADSMKSIAVFSISTSNSTSTLTSLWKGTFYASLWAILSAIYTLVKVEIDQARVLNSWAQLKESAAVGVGASGLALFLLLSSSSDSSSSSSSSPSSSSLLLLLPPLDLAAGGKAAAQILYVATEIEVETVPKFLVALPLALGAGLLVPLLAGSAARGARAVSLSATRTPAWGRETLGLAESLVERCALRCAVLVAPLVAALLWLGPCARIWVASSGKTAGSDDEGAAIDSLRSLSLLLAALASVLAARPSVAAHCGTALVVWWTKKHGFVSRRRGKKSGRNGGRGGGGNGGGGGGNGGGETATTTASAAAAARRRAGEVIRLSMQFINLFALKAGVQALAPGLLWLGCGAISLAATRGSGNGCGKIALWLGGWSTAVFSLCSLWHLTLYWCGWLTDVPSARSR